MGNIKIVAFLLFFLTNIPIFGVLDDQIDQNLTVMSIVAPTDRRVEVLFSEGVDILHLVCQIDGYEGEIEYALTADYRTLVLTLSTPLLSNRIYLYQMAGVRDLEGNFLSVDYYSFAYYKADGGYGSLRFSELMINPKGAIGLPEAEYIELYNAATDSINLGNYRLIYGAKSVGLRPMMIAPNDYLYILHDRYAEFVLPNPRKAMFLTYFPALNNSAQTVQIMNAMTNQLVYSMSYSSRWYNDPQRSTGGFSLECVDLTNPANDIHNWHASSDPRGGTPGEQNSVARYDGDERRAELKQIVFESERIIQLVYNKPLFVPSGTNTGGYSFSENGYSVVAAEVRPDYPERIRLTLNRSLEIDRRIAITIRGITCFRGYKAIEAIDCLIGVPEEAALDDVVINEILFDPLDGGAEFIELYNRSTRLIDLKLLSIASQNESGRIITQRELAAEHVLLAPHSYLLLSGDTARIAQVNGRRGAAAFHELSGLPLLNNSRGALLLLNRQRESIDSLSYEASWHTVPVTAMRKGTSLERIRSDGATCQSSNWASASRSVGFATPGYINSRSLQLESIEEQIKLLTPHFSPNDDGRGDEMLLQYNFGAGDRLVRMDVYSFGGRLWAQPINREIFSGDGLMRWNGRGLQGVALPWGIYVLYIRVNDLDGYGESVYRMPIAITGW